MNIKPYRVLVGVLSPSSALHFLSAIADHHGASTPRLGLRSASTSNAGSGPGRDRQPDVFGTTRTQHALCITHNR